jgi:hypothetical protein
MKKSLMLQAAEAMKIISTPKGTLQMTHCVIEGGYAKVTDGELSIGYPIGTDLEFVTQVVQLTEVAKQIPHDQDATFALSDDGRLLTIVVNQKKMSLSGADRSLIKAGTADSQIAPATDAIRQGFELATRILDPKANDPRTRNAFNDSGCIYASDGAFAVQVHHGVDLPPIAFGTAFMKAVLKIKSPILGFGYSGVSATFHFENGAYVRGRVETAARPDFDQHFADFPSSWLDAKGILRAMRSVLPFSAKGFAIVDPGRVEAFEAAGETFDASFDSCSMHVPTGKAYDAKGLMRIEKMITSVAFGPESDNLFFTDHKTYRGLTKAVVKPDPVLYITSDVEPFEDEIPY